MTTPFIVAFDFSKEADALRLADVLDPSLCRAKVGKELFTRCGPSIVKQLTDRGYDVFLDLKFHDIPNTVAAAVKVAANMGVWMLTVHAAGGRCMLEQSRNVLQNYGAQRPRLVAVTLLTSLDSADLRELGIGATAYDYVLHMVNLSRDCGLDGVVCSAHEAARLRASTDPEFLLVTPGIRQPDALQSDQKRTLSAREAVAAGSSYLVVGRPITQSEQPMQTLRALIADISYSAN
ncbi:MAG: orotidine-5'-phosphate decarboxylase [Pseudomonadales bacterium]